MLVKALKKLYKKITGKESEHYVASKIIDELATDFAFPAAELPEYTASDAGKVLAVKSDGSGLEWIALE